MKPGMDVPTAIERYIEFLTMKKSIQSGQTVASYTSAVVDMLKTEGIVHDPKLEVYTPRVTGIISGFGRLCESKKPERRLRVRLCYCFSQFMLVADHIRLKYQAQGALRDELLAFAGFHWGAAPRINEILHTPLSTGVLDKIHSLGRVAEIEKEKGILTNNLAFIYPVGKPPSPAGNKPDCGAIGVGFFTLSKRNNTGITGCRGFPAAPVGVDDKYCPVKLLHTMVRRHSPQPGGYLFDSFPNKKRLIVELGKAMKEVAYANMLDPKRFTPHCTRIGAIKHMQEHGISGHTQAMHLGHSNVSSKAAYDHAGFGDVLGLREALFDSKVGDMDEMRFVYMPGLPFNTVILVNDDAQEGEQEY